MKYYAVKKGNTVGVFNNWADCNTAIKGYSGAEFKSFSTKEEADAFINDEDIYFEQVKKDIEEGYAVAYCDGSYDEQKRRYAYGVVVIDKELKEHEMCGYSNNQKYVSNQNIAGELLGAINAMDWAVTNGYGKIRIYHDYEGVSKWISGEWKAKSDMAVAYVNVYNAKFADILEVDFQKVKGHSNNRFNDRADDLAKSAIEERKHLVINGGNWFSVPYFSEEELRTIIRLISEEYSTLTIEESESLQKLSFKLRLDGYKLTVIFFKTKNKKLLVQGKNDFLFQIFVSFILELLGIGKVDPILNNVYRRTINSEEISKVYKELFSDLPRDYPENIRILLRQAIINTKYFIESEEYGQYAFPALRALEGHLKYILKKEGHNIIASSGFNVFDKDPVSNAYVLKPSIVITDASARVQIEKCYNCFNKTRHTIFHFGDIIGNTDSSRMIETKEEADEIIQECIVLINESF